MSNEFTSNLKAILDGVANNIICADEAMEELQHVLELAAE